MAEGHNRAAWAHTSSLMALLANCHSAKKKYQPSDFNPVASRQVRPATAAEVGSILGRIG